MSLQPHWLVLRTFSSTRLSQFCKVDMTVGYMEGNLLLSVCDCAFQKGLGRASPCKHLVDIPWSDYRSIMKNPHSLWCTVYRCSWSGLWQSPYFFHRWHWLHWYPTIICVPTQSTTIMHEHISFSWFDRWTNWIFPSHHWGKSDHAAGWCKSGHHWFRCRKG